MITLNTPALLFPAVSLILLAYTNRFMSLSKLIRDLHARWQTNHDGLLVPQIRNLSRRLRLCRDMQVLGILCMLCCVVSMLLIWQEHPGWATVAFTVSLILLAGSMTLSLMEIWISTGALEHELADMRGDGIPGMATTATTLLAPWRRPRSRTLSRHTPHAPAQEGMDVPSATAGIVGEGVPTPPQSSRPGAMQG